MTPWGLPRLPLLLLVWRLLLLHVLLALLLAVVWQLLLVQLKQQLLFRLLLKHCAGLSAG
jgi:hypothetical protein